jgi:hypothetical protein
MIGIERHHFFFLRFTTEFAILMAEASERPFFSSELATWPHCRLAVADFAFLV